MDRNFYLTLPSNTKASEINKISEFYIPLAHTVELEGSWEVGLAEIQYPVSFETFNTSGFKISLFDYDFVKGFFQATRYVVVPASHFDTPQQLVHALNTASSDF